MNTFFHPDSVMITTISGVVNYNSKGYDRTPQLRPHGYQLCLCDIVHRDKVHSA